MVHFSGRSLRNPPITSHEGKLNMNTNSFLHIAVVALCLTDGDAYSEKVFSSVV